MNLTFNHLLLVLAAVSFGLATVTAVLTDLTGRFVTHFWIALGLLLWLVTIIAAH